MFVRCSNICVYNSKKFEYFRCWRGISNQKYVFVVTAGIAHFVQNVPGSRWPHEQPISSCSAIRTSESRFNKVTIAEYLSNQTSANQISLARSSRKLHEIQNSLMSAPSVFYIPNLENCDHRAGNIIGTHEFLLQQYELNVIWHLIEGQPAVSRCIDVQLKNMRYFMERSSIDFASSIQLTFDVICQLSEVWGKFSYYL